jgi:peptidoglycan/LPS O-acetylase OafA/YrhL
MACSVEAMSIHHDHPVRGESASAIAYRPQIDTLRAIAVGSVMFEHYLPWQFHKLGLMDGVLVFFAISGFLITSILLDYKAKIAGRAGGFGRAFATFYARRALRIFPAYYLLLFALLFAGAFAGAGSFFWHLTYTTNIWTAINGKWDAVAGHFWSLAVEEQFYLVWPLIVLAAPRRALPWIMLAGIPIGVAFRACALQFDWGLAIITLPMANFDALFGGALLAWAHRDGPPSWLAFFRKYGLWSFVSVPLLFVMPHDLGSVLAPTLTALMSVYVIDQCVIGYRGWLGWLFSRPLVLYLGKISYGLYLYHYVVQHYLDVSWIGDLGPLTPYAHAALWALATVVIAAISWRFIEAPINAQKRRFTLSADGRAPAAAQWTGAPSP